MFTLWRDLDRALFNQTWEDFLSKTVGNTNFLLTALPSNQHNRMNLYDSGENLEFIIELPAVKAEDIDLTIHSDTLVLKTKRMLKNEEENATYLLKERTDYNINHNISLPVQVNAEKTVANLKDGLLKVTMPKIAELQSKKITVNA